MLPGRGSTPPLSEEPLLDVHPPCVERLGSAEAFDLYHRIRTIDDELVAVAVEDRANLAADDAFGAAEETNHEVFIGGGSRNQ